MTSKEGRELVPADSPIASQAGMRMFFAIGVEAGWDFWNFDARTAFLKQDELYMDERRQKLYLEPPVELRSSPDEIWETLKVPYGCTDAPRAWYFTFAKWLCDQGGHALPNDMCIYTFYEHGVLVGQLIVHVDDGILAWTPEFLAKMSTKLKTR